MPSFVDIGLRRSPPTHPLSSLFFVVRMHVRGSEAMVISSTSLAFFMSRWRWKVSIIVVPSVAAIVVITVVLHLATVVLHLATVKVTGTADVLVLAPATVIGRPSLSATVIVVITVRVLATVVRHLATVKVTATVRVLVTVKVLATAIGRPSLAVTVAATPLDDPRWLSRS